MSGAVVTDCHFERDTHAYTVDGGRRVMSVTQALQLAGLCSYEGVPEPVMKYAQWRGSVVHDATMRFDQGFDVEATFEVPEAIVPYLAAYRKFRVDCKFVPFREEIEKPRVVRVRGLEYAMTPDRVGLLDGTPAVVEIKATADAHPSWGIQLAGYEGGLPRSARFRNYSRVAVQLRPDGSYTLHMYSAESDFDLFAHAYSVAAWKLNKRLVQLAA